MKIESKFMTGIASRFIKKAVCNKLGCDMDIQLNGFRTTVLDDKTHVHLDIDLELTKDGLNKLMKSIGLWGQGRITAAFALFADFANRIMERQLAQW